ncbi:MAG: hypothetical protein AAB575_02860 [Patescibacteria group bacterium]
MSVEVKRKKGETFESFVRRFSRRMMQSGTVLEFKKKAYKRRPLSKLRLKATTLSHKVYREKREYLKKIGRLKEEQAPTRRKF